MCIWNANPGSMFVFILHTVPRIAIITLLTILLLESTSYCLLAKAWGVNGSRRQSTPLTAPMWLSEYYWQPFQLRDTSRYKEKVHNI